LFTLFVRPTYLYVCMYFYFVELVESTYGPLTCPLVAVDVKVRADTYIAHQIATGRLSRLLSYRHIVIENSIRYRKYCSQQRFLVVRANEVKKTSKQASKRAAVGNRSPTKTDDQKIRCCETRESERDSARCGARRQRNSPLALLASVSLFRDGPDDHVAACSALSTGCL
jgi:hypothetical protein